MRKEILKWSYHISHWEISEGGGGRKKHLCIQLFFVKAINSKESKYLKINLFIYQDQMVVYWYMA